MSTLSSTDIQKAFKNSDIINHDNSLVSSCKLSFKTLFNLNLSKYFVLYK